MQIGYGRGCSPHLRLPLFSCIIDGKSAFYNVIPPFLRIRLYYYNAALIIQIQHADEKSGFTLSARRADKPENTKRIVEFFAV